MKDLLYYARVAFLLVSTGSVAAWGVAGWRFLRIEESFTAKTGILARLEGIETKINATAVNIDNASKVWSNSAQEQANSLRAVGADVHKFLGVATVAVSETSRNTNKDLADLDATIKASTTLEETATTAVARIQAPVDAATETFSDLNAILQDPDITETITNSNKITNNLAGITGDIKDETDKIVHPAPCKGKFCALKHFWTALNASEKLGQMWFYWSNSSF